MVQSQPPPSTLDAQTVAYLHKKHTGGKSGAKGVHYECLFAAVQVARAAHAHGRACAEVSLEQQTAWTFLDDLKIINGAAEPPRHSYYQLKNTDRLAWSSGKGSLAWDCKQQAELCASLKEGGAECVIVTSSQDAERRLKASMPDELAKFTRVLWFPWKEPLPKLCSEEQGAFLDVAWLSKHAEPSANDLVEVLTLMLGQWQRHEGPVTALEIIDQARAISPTLLRPLVSDEEAARALRRDFKAALEKIQNFSYRIVKGFLAWEMRHPNGTVDAGVLSHDCLSHEFAAFQSRVVKLDPVTFESMEDQLL